jgi:Cys-rich repeat protein
MSERTHTTPRRWALLAVLAVALIGTALAGCAREDYYCDSTGCYFCDGLGCRPAQPPSRTPCDNGQTCAAGQVCTNLGCAIPCGADADCPRGWICRGTGGDAGASRGFCASPTEPVPMPPSCTSNAQCAAGNVCIDGTCRVSSTPACTNDTQCTSGQICVSGRCTPRENTCTFNNQCGAGRLCVNNECRVGCGGSVTCPTGQECVTTTSGSYCRDQTTAACMRDTDCGAGRRCLNATCYQACTPGATTCGAELYCSNDGVCIPDTRPRPFCDATRPCQAGSECVGGVCRVPCTTSTQCQMVDVTYRNCGQIPNQSTNTRTYCLTDSEFRPVCQRQSECGMGQVCIDGLCR